MVRLSHRDRSWIVGGLILAAAIIAGAFIERGATAPTQPHRAAFTVEAHILGATASVRLW